MEPKCLQSRSAQSGCSFKSTREGVIYICNSSEPSDRNVAMNKSHKTEIHYLAAGNKKGNPGLKPSV